MSDQSDDHAKVSPDGPVARGEPSVRGSVELPRVELGDDTDAHPAPKRRVLPGLVDIRWLSYPAYVACFVAGGLAVNFAIDGREWAAGPVALAWAMLFFWEWLYAVAYRYRRRLLKYGSLLMVAGLTAGLAVLCWERAGAQIVAQLHQQAAGPLAERGSVDALDWAATVTVTSGALVAAHMAILGRGYREISARGKNEPRHDDRQPPDSTPGNQRRSGSTST